MPQGQLGSLMRQIRRLFGGDAGALTPDAELLRQFVELRDEEAFTALVQRHGPLVMGLCRRMLADGHQAEDAFQAVFMILAKRAAAIRRPEALPSWLYGVAYRVAARARGRARQRSLHESQVTAMPGADAAMPDRPAYEPDPVSETTRRELRAVIDEELNRLPEKYRLPMILCYLEGKTNEEAAQQLRWTKGTVSGQLARGRDLLRNRLARRGVALSAAGLATGLSQTAATAAMPVALVEATVKGSLEFVAGQASVGGAAELARETLHGMLVAKIKTAASVMCVVGVIGSVGGAVAYQGWANATPQATNNIAPTTGEPAKDVAPANVDPHRAEQATLVLRVRKQGEDRNAQGLRWQEVVILNVLKNTTGKPIGHTLLVASSVHKYGVPAGECTIYLEPLHTPPDGHWKLRGDGAPEGISHPAAAH